MVTRFAFAFGLNEFSMPTKDRVRLSNRGDLSKLLSSESFRLHRQNTPLIVTQQDSFAPQLLAKYLILQPKVFGYLFLFFAYGLTEYSQDHL